MRNHARARRCALARVHAVRDNEKSLPLMVSRSMFPANLDIIRSKISECTHTRSLCTHARASTVREHVKYVVLNTSSSTFPANLERIRLTVWSRHDCSVHSEDTWTAGDNWFLVTCTSARVACTHKIYSPRNVSWPVEGFPPNLEKIRWELWKHIAGQTDRQTHRHTDAHTEIPQFIVRYIYLWRQITTRDTEFG
jgi:hypothetical protein